jgi:hypothetical protein
VNGPRSSIDQQARLRPLTSEIPTKYRLRQIGELAPEDGKGEITVWLMTIQGCLGKFKQLSLRK